MQGGFNFEFLNVASALKRTAEAPHRENARVIAEIYISLGYLNRIDQRKFVQNPKLSSRWLKRSTKTEYSMVPESKSPAYTKIIG